ncbi:hypothetical protein F5Y11DRAFT_361476 [Daldinia sp. FL1419]|nr:hypothetical protein F5Y11DRAFT_361476 [Daldinia sp. FL1419]
MTSNGIPPMPLAASASMSMGKKKSTTTLGESGSVASDSSTQQRISQNDTVGQSIHLEHTEAPMRNSDSKDRVSTANAKQDRTRRREEIFNLQRIQLAEKLSVQNKQCTVLEASVTSLQDKLASLKISNETLESECERLHGQIYDANEKLKSHTDEKEEKERVMSEKITDLQSKLEEVSKSLEKSIAERDRFDKQDDAAQEQDRDSLKESYEADKIQLKQQAASKDTELRDLRQEMNNLEDAFADSVGERETMQKELDTRSDKFKAESQEQQQSIDNLRKLTEPFAQSIVICVDMSGSVFSIVNDIKQIYRDVLHMIKLYNSEAKVATVVHGIWMTPPVRTQLVSAETFRTLDSLDSSGGEDYTFCMENAREILQRDTGTDKLIVLIGDGDMGNSDRTSLFSICDQLKFLGIRAHSIIVSKDSHLTCTYETIQTISQATDGQVQTEDDYMSALDEILRNEREEHFKTH